MLYRHLKTNEIYYRIARGYNTTDSADDAPIIIYAKHTHLTWYERVAFYVITWMIRWVLKDRIAWFARNEGEFQEKFVDLGQELSSKAALVDRTKDSIK